MNSIKIVVASGKGGVGKSMLASTLAMLFSLKRSIVAIDADVDAPNLSLWLGGIKKWDKIKRISVTEKAVAIKKKCPDCQKCIDICQFGALSLKNNQLKINPFLCEGCGACQEVCPPGTIKMRKVTNGEIMVKNNIFGFPLISAQLYPGQTSSGKIVDEIKKQAQDFKSQVAIIDSPAGTSCPVISAINGADFAILITEPTPAGFTDLKRVLKIVDHFKIPWALVVNKWNMNIPQSRLIISWADTHFLGKISYDQKIFKAIANFRPILKTNLLVKREINQIFIKLLKKLPPVNKKLL